MTPNSAETRGTLSAFGNNGTQLDTITSPSASQSWSLDSVGNWSGVTTNGSTTTQTFKESPFRIMIPGD